MIGQIAIPWVISNKLVNYPQLSGIAGELFYLTREVVF
jgi:hypothetical protein